MGTLLPCFCWVKGTNLYLFAMCADIYVLVFSLFLLALRSMCGIAQNLGTVLYLYLGSSATKIYIGPFALFSLKYD